MKRARAASFEFWKNLSPRFLPFADAASEDLPLGRLLRLSLFQISVGMAVVLVSGTLNRLMIVELNVHAWVVAVMLALPLLLAPFRTLIGYRSDHHRSYLGWRRVPYIWLGTLLQFGGLAIMPFALLVLTSSQPGAAIGGPLGAALAFFLVGLGMHMTQTAGLALATDLVPEEKRARAVALIYVMLLVGMAGSAVAFGWLLRDFDEIRLIRVIQGAAVLTLVLNVIALWRQEPRRPELTRHDRERPPFREVWRDFLAGGQSGRLLIAVGLGTAGFTMQDILLEPYGGEVLGLSIAETTTLSALLAAGSLAGLAVAARRLGRGGDPHRLAGFAAVVGIFAFAAVVFADPLGSALVFRIGTALIGFGGGLFAVCTMTAAMRLAEGGRSGLALGAWGAVQASAAGIAIALGGVIRDGVTALGAEGALGPAFTGPAVGYGVVYHVEIVLLFMTLVAIGPLVRRTARPANRKSPEFGLAELPA